MAAIAELLIQHASFSSELHAYGPMLMYLKSVNFTEYSNLPIAPYSMLMVLKNIFQNLTLKIQRTFLRCTEGNERLSPVLIPVIPF